MAARLKPAVFGLYIISLSTLAVLACSWKFNAANADDVAGPGYFNTLRIEIEDASLQPLEIDQNLSQFDIEKRAEHIQKGLTSLYHDSKWGVIVFSALREPEFDVPPTLILMYFNNDSELYCNRTVPPPSCAILGGALMNSVRIPGTPAFLRAVVIFIPDSSLTSDGRAVLADKTAKARQALMECAGNQWRQPQASGRASSLAQGIKLRRLETCIRESRFIRAYLPLFWALAYEKRAALSAPTGGLMVLDVPPGSLPGLEFYLLMF